MSVLIHQEALEQRAKNLGTHNLNGLELVIVHLAPATAPTQAFLDLYFYNSREVTAILAAIATPAIEPSDIFPILGGRRVRAGAEPGQVRVVSVLAGSAVSGIASVDVPRALRLVVSPIGDYSTYRLTIQFAGIDPIFSELPFKFRPGCFTTECIARDKGEPRAATDSAIDYTARDYASFRHALISAMGRRMPGWSPTSEPDLSQTLIDYLSAAADELADYQDRVVNERALATARSRVSLARHARLMDYHVHQGNQASTWLALEVAQGHELAFAFEATATTADGSQVFELRPERDELDPDRDEEPWLTDTLNELSLYTWSDARAGLEIGATSADLALTRIGEALPFAAARARGQRVVELINTGKVRRLLIWEALDPATGRRSGRDPRKRQLLTLVPVPAAGSSRPRPAIVDDDPFTGEPYLRVTWRDEDALLHPYCGVMLDGAEIRGVTLVGGNLIRAHHGRREQLRFVRPGATPHGRNERNWRRTRWGAICELPNDALVLYRDTAPGGEQESIATLAVNVITTATSEWHERISLVHSEDEEHFAVETDELLRTTIRFGNGVNGAELPDGATVDVDWQSGNPLAGNIGAEALTRVDHAHVVGCWNPFDVTNARSPESRSQIVRRVPEAFRARQLRCVTLSDVVERAEELDDVARAAARYTWTGSWTAIQLVIDPVGTDVLRDELRREVAAHMAPLMLIGDDLEIRAARYVPLHIKLDICLHPDFWPEDVRADIDEELSDGYTADGRPGLFHPDRWTFGQNLYASEVIGRIHAVEGVEHVVSVDLQRYREHTPGPSDRIVVQAFEIIQVRNDPDDMERGLIEIVNLRGGRG